MCGICGFVNLNGEPASKTILGKMNQALIHRGPDDSGTLLDGAVAMAMRRLSIQDVDHGHQPISNEDQTVWIVFNGEIYNSPELRDQLQGGGHEFSTCSDTEVIVHQYENSAENCVDFLRGMFAFALLDKKPELDGFRMLIARDRLGIKPLYYYHDENVLVFASELTSLVQHPAIVRDIEPQALYQYLATGIVAAPLTLFKNVRQLMPGQLMNLENGKLSFRTYWTIPEVEDSVLSEADAVDKIRDMLELSVREHLLSDVPVGAFLSGGIDSSAIVALMAQASDKPVPTFSIRFEEDGYDESYFARLVAERYNTDHHEFTIHNRGFNESFLRSLITHHGQPTADSSAIPTFIVSALAREHVKVALSGDGGDECFAGYSHYGWLQQINRLYALPKLVRKIVLKLCYGSATLPLLAQSARLRQLINALEVSMSPQSRMPFEVLRLNRDADIDQLLAAEWKSCVSESSELDDFLDFQSGGLIGKVQRFSFRYFLPDAYLPKVDRMSMAASLEVRVPFLDHRLVEFALKLSGEKHWKYGQGKNLLRKAVADLLPEEIFTHKKQGFSIPLHRWAAGKYFDLAEDLLSEQAVIKRGLFDYIEVRRLLDICRESGGQKQSLVSEHRLSHRLFMLVLLEMWCRMYIDELIEQPVHTDLSEIISHV
jgi:asparagine synthase (glutamine-hydrolysing)